MILIFIGFYFLGIMGANMHMILYYIPFETQTYMPVTRELIEKQATCTFNISPPNKSADVLKQIIEKTNPGNFDNRVVRLKIVSLYREDIYVDQDGGIYQNGVEAKLAIDGLQELKRFMDKLKVENPRACK